VISVWEQDDEARKAADENYCGCYKSLADYAEELTDQRNSNS